MVVTRPSTGSIQDTGVWLFIAIAISALSQRTGLGCTSCHDNRQPLASLVWLFLFVCLWSLFFFFCFNLSEKPLIWIFQSSGFLNISWICCKPVISLSLDVSSQWDRMKGRIWNKILSECQPAVEEAGILPRENICWSFVRVGRLIQGFGVSLSVLNLWMHSHLCGWIHPASPWMLLDMFWPHNSIEKTVSVPCVQEKDLSELQRSCFLMARDFVLHSCMGPLVSLRGTKQKPAPPVLPLLTKVLIIQLLPDRTMLSQVGALLNGSEQTSRSGNSERNDCPYSPLTNTPTSQFLEQVPLWDAV